MSKARRITLLPPALRDDATVQVLPLPTGIPGVSGRFVVSQGRLYEFVSVQDGARSWFADDSVCEDGSLYMAVVADPLFLILPVLSAPEHATHFCTLDNVLGGPYAPLGRLPEIGAQLKAVCDVQSLGGDDVAEGDGAGSNDQDLVFRLNRDKVMAWLQSKVDTLALRLQGRALGSLAPSSRPAQTQVDGCVGASPSPIPAMSVSTPKTKLPGTRPATLPVKRSRAEWDGSVEDSTGGSSSAAPGRAHVKSSVYRVQAVEILCEYLAAPWHDRLRALYIVPKSATAGTPSKDKFALDPSKSGASTPAGSESVLHSDIKFHGDDGTHGRDGGGRDILLADTPPPMAAPRAPQSAPPASKASKVLKRPKGMRSLTSFFKKL